MSAIRLTEIPQGLDASYWPQRDQRIDLLGRKHMDTWANTPFNQIPGPEIRRNKANFTHYSTMMEQGSRAYIWDALRRRLGSHMGNNIYPGTYTLLDAGAGNGRVAKKMASLLRETFPGDTELILAERSAPALDTAYQSFADQYDYSKLSTNVGGQFTPLYHLTQDDEDQATDQTLRFLHEDLNALSLPDQSVDAVACMMVLHHQKLQEMLKTISELERVLKPGGMAVLIDTGAFPQRGWQRLVVPWIVRMAISPGKMLAADKKAGVETGEAEMKGYQDFGKRDGLLAFDFAVDQPHWRELMQRSTLGIHLTEVEALKSPNPVVASIFPALNLAVAVKK